MENENTDDKKLLLDHDFDGIRELDNDPPPWLMWVLYLSIAFSVAYMLIYHVFDFADTQEAEYAKEIVEWDRKKAAIQLEKEAKGETIDESNLTLLSSDADMNEGAALYASKTCTACHGNLGEGNAIGPNLADAFWINGGSPEEIFKVIKVGVPAKGMTAFKDQLSDEQILQLTSYIYSKMIGSNPPNAKEAQGEKVE